MTDPTSSRTHVRDSQTGSMRDCWVASFAGLDLAALGWARAARSAPADLITEHPDAAPARVIRVDRGRLLLVVDGAGPPRHVHDRTGAGCVVGDWVLCDPPSPGTDGCGLARARLPRVGTLARRDPDAPTEPQVVAANVDLVLVAEALDPGRVVNEARIARFAALAAAGGAATHVLLTGADRTSEPPPVVAGLPATATSIVDGRGLDEVRALLPPGTTAVIVGASGAGKSSIANAMLGGPLLAIAERRASGTGRHTTAVSRLLPLPDGGLLVDTPGVRLVGMHAGVGATALVPGVVDDLASSCRFGDCRHDTEPGCAVAAAIDAGTIAAGDLDGWRRLERESLRERARADARLRRELHEERMSRTRAHAKARRRGEIVERRR